MALLQRCERLQTGAEYAALLAFAQAALRAERRITPELRPAWERRDLVLTGHVDSSPFAITGQCGLPGWLFEFAVESIGPTGAALPPEVPRRLMLLTLTAPYHGQRALVLHRTSKARARPGQPG